MKVSNPVSRYKLRIPPKASVLDVGSGHNPHPRANVLTDKYIDSNFHRASDIKVLKNQKFVEADGQSLPFSDKEFDYVICCHVAEHTERPDIFLNELSRVGHSGYLEVPSLLGELLSPKRSHKWVILEIEEKLVFYEKNKINFDFDAGETFMKYLPKSSIGYKILQRTHPMILTVNYEWRNGINYIVNPRDERVLRYFEQPWDEEMFNHIFRPKSIPEEFIEALRAYVDIFKSVIISKVRKNLL